MKEIVWFWEFTVSAGYARLRSELQTQFDSGFKTKPEAYAFIGGLLDFVNNQAAELVFITDHVWINQEDSYGREDIASLTLKQRAQ